MNVGFGPNSRNEPRLRFGDFCVTAPGWGRATPDWSTFLHPMPTGTRSRSKERGALAQAHRGARSAPIICTCLWAAKDCLYKEGKKIAIRVKTQVER
jgi:hypothetical protein